MTNIKWLKANCPICGREYQYTEAYKPKTCSNFDCLYQYNHKEAMEKIARMKREASNNAS